MGLLAERLAARMATRPECVVKAILDGAKAVDREDLLEFMAMDPKRCPSRWIAEEMQKLGYGTQVVIKYLGDVVSKHRAGTCGCG